MPVMPLDAAGASLQREFEHIYATRAWSDGNMSVPRSGPGATREATAPLVAALLECFARLRIESLLDVGCGDLTWMRHVEPVRERRVRYHGVDIARAPLSEAAPHVSDWARLTCADARTYALPAADLVLCKDVLSHLDDADALDLLRNVARSECRYVLLSSARAVEYNDAHLAEPWRWRPLNLRLPPFSLRYTHEQWQCGDTEYLLLSRAQLDASLRSAEHFQPLSGRNLMYTGPFIGAEQVRALSLPDVTPLLPRIVHVMWVGDAPLPEYVPRFVDDWRRILAAPPTEPQWQVRLWRNEDLHEGEFPHEVLERAHAAQKGAQKADILRLFILLKYGGWWFDSDCEPLQSLEPLARYLAESTAFACHYQQWDAAYCNNAVMASSAAHPWIEAACDECMRVQLNTDDINWTTGPGCIARSMQPHMDVLVLPPSFFYPVHYMRPDEPFDSAASYCRHRWAKSW